MCQYSCVDGVPTDWHLVHLGSRAVGGAGVVVAEATAVEAEGRITPADSGIWNDGQADAWSRVASFVREQGAVAAIQIAHAGRKGSCEPPWHGGRPLPPSRGGWIPLAPSPLPFAEGHPVPREADRDDLDRVREAFAAAARRAVRAGFQAVELHMAHGYLLNEFLSPVTNRRKDGYGGTLEKRMRFPLEVARAVREALPAEVPLLVRISATDWEEDGWEIGQSVEFALRLKDLGADLVDCSSGGVTPTLAPSPGPGFQVPFAETVRREAGIATAAVGFLTDPAQAEQVVATGQADAVVLAREMLRDPYWPLHAARALGADVPWPVQYERAKPAK
jgi:2,4-dienoyl-CoA reductase-like NADH-dependent reductase (Old Yellow Enzyme family)